MTREDIVQRLMREHGYSRRAADVVAADLETLHPSLRAELEQWWHYGVIPTAEVRGYTVQRLNDEHGMNPVAALLTLDWLLREPEAALASLQFGHDHVAELPDGSEPR